MREGNESDSESESEADSPQKKRYHHYFYRAGKGAGETATGEEEGASRSFVSAANSSSLNSGDGVCAHSSNASISAAFGILFSSSPQNLSLILWCCFFRMSMCGVTQCRQSSE